MAAGFSPQTPGGSRHLSKIRVVIFGNNEIDKSKVVKSILGYKCLKVETVGRCTLFEGERDGRRISIVEAPGWEVSMQKTPKSIKKEVERSVSLCPPGPHALLLVIPVKVSEEASAGEIKAAQTHMELLSERVWKHTILLFACDEGMGDFAIKAHFQKAKKILEKCKGRSYVLESRAKITELFTQIDDLVEENSGEFFIPQDYYELIKHKKKEASGESELRQRSGSLEIIPPNMTKAKRDILDDPQALLMHYWKPISVIVMAVFGALLGAVTGAEYGIPGASAGLLLGSILFVLLAFLIFKVTENNTD